MDEQELERFFTIAQVAKILQTDYETIRKYLQAEVIPPDKWFKIGGIIRIKRTAILDL